MRVLSFRMPLRFLRGNVPRLVLSVLALACGVALVCAIDLVNRAAFTAFAEIIDTMAGRAALQVSAGDSGFFPEELAETIGAVPGVELAVPVVTATAFTTDGSGELLTVHGVDVTSDDTVRVYAARDASGIELEDPLVFLNAPDSILLTRAFATRRGISEGDTLALQTPKGTQTFTVRGLLDAEGLARVYGGNLVVMDLYAAEIAFTEPGFVNRVDVVVDRGERVESIAAAVRDLLPSGMRVDTPAQRKADLHEVMRSLQAMLSGVGLIALVAAFLIAYNRLATVYEGRLWQLGVMSAVGVRPRALWWELVKESTLLGSAGVVVGIPLGIALGRLLLPVVASTAALNYKLVAPETALAVHPGSLLLATALGLGAALLAASVPAWQIARRAAVEALRSRGGEAPHRRTMVGAVVRGGVFLGVGTTLAAQWLTRSPEWGLAATALIAIALALSARPLVGVIVPALAPILRRLTGAGGRLAVSMVLSNQRRMGLTVATLGVGLGSVLWLATVAQSFERSVVDALGRAMRADLVVSSAHIASGFLEAPVSEQLVADLRRVPGVEEVAGWRALEWPHEGGPVGISAYDPVYFLDRGFGEWPLHGISLADPWEAVAGGEAVVVSTSFALNLQKGAGDIITLDTPTGPLSLPVAGITTDFVSPRGTVEISRDVFRHFWNDHQITRAFVRTTPGAAVQDVRAAIAQRFGHTYGLRVLSSGELLAYFSAQVRKAFAVIPILGALVLFVVLVGMADTLAASVMERNRDLGVMRAIGVRPGKVERMILVEGGLLAVLGLVLAGGGGTLLGYLWVHATFPYLLGWVLEFYAPYAEAAAAATVTLAACLLAALVPARRAARCNPIVALRHE
jgi:putative ABC transport system permease protein